MNSSIIFKALEYEVGELAAYERNRERKHSKIINVKESINTISSLCDNILRIDLEKSVERYVKFIKSVCCFRLGYYNQAVRILMELGYDDLWISKQDEHLKTEMFNIILQDEITDSNVNLSLLIYCKEIYCQILNILQQLLIQDDSKAYNLYVCHYTTVEVAEKLMFEPQSPFRMCSVSTVNDPLEGKVLYNYLKCPPWNKMDNEKNEYQCFIGCFALDPESLNHFRLYGKENEKEATGISISFKPDSFINYAKSQLSFKTKKDFDYDYYSLHLYRCLYIHPSENKKIASCAFVGNSDLLELEKSLNDLDCKISLLLKDKKNEEYENLIGVISRMLMPLSYLIKHAAFKEEQECRLFSIQKLGENERIKFCSTSRRIYIEPLFPMDDLHSILFAPKVSESDYNLFKDRLAMKSKDVSCKKSKLQLA